VKSPIWLQQWLSAAWDCSRLVAAGGGSAGSTTSTPQAPAPTAMIKADSGASAGGSGAALQASVGSTIVLASASTAGSGATIASYAWSLDGQPHRQPGHSPGDERRDRNLRPGCCGNLRPAIDGNGFLGPDRVAVCFDQRKQHAARCGRGREGCF